MIMSLTLHKPKPASAFVMYCILFMLMSGLAFSQPIRLDETPAGEDEWGYRPVSGSVSQVNPPSFTWRPMEGMTWELECAADTTFAKVEYRADGLVFNVHCPSRTFKPGTWAWRYRGTGGDGRTTTGWSVTRTFTIPADAAVMPMPSREELIARIPETHPRLFVRPENIDRLKTLAHGELKENYEALVEQCEKILASPPSVEEPPKYPEGTVTNSDPWREIWWGNRMKVIAALDGAATLAFTRLLGGPERYGMEAKRILLSCATWDPVGSTGFRYNDEAGMPYAYYFSRTYTFVNDLLTEDEKQACRRVMKIRGDEMYRNLYPRHLWKPYSSHSNRAWHFLGEVGIAFCGEVEGAEDWVWFAASVFFNVYPVWSDDDGGWHEGSAYWQSYQERFTWWADVMREALGINAFEKPYYSKVGYYALYLMPPGKVGGGFGDLTATLTSASFTSLMTTFAAQARNGHWEWWVERNGGPKPAGGYIGFIRGALPGVESKAPDDLPSSRLFMGTGQAMLNTTLTDAGADVQVVFKSSPLGTQSHGYEANNSFLLWAYGKRLLIRSGRRDSYGSEHHTNWMWSTRSVNCIRINGKDQPKRSSKAKGEITAFKTTPAMDIVVGRTEHFTRAVLFVKPDLVIVYDRLDPGEPSSYEYWLHAVNKIDVTDQHRIRVTNDDVVCDIDFLAPSGLTFTQTDQYDPNPRPRITLREWHLTATTPEKKDRLEFVTIYRPHKIGDRAPDEAVLEPVSGGYGLRVKLADGECTALLPTDDSALLRAYGLESRGAIKMRVKRDSGAVEELGLEK
ncbi:DUF4962 domain-containing protein [bacterium]|nr:DUF4962 domain-containing protein [bacterium]